MENPTNAYADYTSYSNALNGAIWYTHMGEYPDGQPSEHGMRIEDTTQNVNPRIPNDVVECQPSILSGIPPLNLLCLVQADVPSQQVATAMIGINGKANKRPNLADDI